MGLGSSPIRLRATTDVKLFEESKQTKHPEKEDL